MSQKLKSTFPISELVLKNSSLQEQERTREIFEILKEKAIRGEHLSEHEKTFFCNGVKFSRYPEDGVIENYVCCENYKFKMLFLPYFPDFTGGRVYQKVKIGHRPPLQPVSAEEAAEDIKYLLNKADEWEEVIKKENHSDELLKQISKETRNELKNLDKTPEFASDLFAKGKFRYRYKRWRILLNSQYNYLVGLEIFEKLHQDDFRLQLNSEIIEFNEFSLCHILNRHYAPLAKQYATGKSFIPEDFNPRILTVQLKNVLKLIDDSKALTGKQIERIAFNQDGKNFTIWTSMETKQVKGKGNVPYRRLNTFYEVLEEGELANLRSYELIPITSSLRVYMLI